MFCTKCGMQTADGIAFCPNCGQDLRVAAVQQPAPITDPITEPVAEIFSEPIAEPSAQIADVTAVEPVQQPVSFTILPAAAPVIEPAAAPLAETVIVPAASAAVEPPVMTRPAASAGVYTDFSKPAAPEQKSKSAGDSGSGVGAFFKEYFKDPIHAVSSRAKKEYWLWGLISIGSYLVIHFILSLFGIGLFRDFGYQFGYFIADIVGFATLIFAYLLFQSVFRVKKKSLLEIIAVTGLALLPILPVYLVGFMLDSAFAFSNILSGLLTAVFVFAGIIMYTELKDSSDDKTGFRSLLTIVVSIACMPIISGLIDFVVARIQYAFYY